MTQQSGSQFEDDLTIGIDEDETFVTDSIDLLGVGGSGSSPIARLKTIILSIDWEINDDILNQLDEELYELGTTWADDKIKQVYVQGLSKIGKYIYKEKAGAHPNAIKLLITFYHNLEKIIINEESMSEEEKKELLLADVKKFDQLKSQISKPIHPGSAANADNPDEEPAVISEFSVENDEITELKTLKAQVLGIDWEINDEEIGKLGTEVKRLETVFSNNKPKLILLQGIGALSSYINKNRSQSHSGSFTLLHSFYGTLEKVCGGGLSAADEKQLLLAEVSKFNQFKAEISTEKESPAVSPGSVFEPAEETATEPAPAFADSPAALSDDEPVEDYVSTDSPLENDEEKVVAADVSSRLESVFGEDDDSTSEGVDRSEALEGVNVETEADDDSDEEALPYEDGSVAPALAGVETDSSFSVEKLADDLYVAPPTAPPEAIIGDDIEEEEKDFTLEDTGPAQGTELFADSEDEEDGSSEALNGVDVETEADDDSDEESLPMEEGELAPALTDTDGQGGFNADSMAAEFDSSDAAAIEDRLGAFFDDEVSDSAEGWVSETADEVSEDEGDENSGDIVAALSDVEEDFSDNAVADETISEQEQSVSDDLFPEPDEEPIVAAETESLFADFDDDTDVASPSDEGEEEDEPADFLVEDTEPIAALSDSDETSFFAEETETSLEQINAEEAIAEGLSFLDDDDVEEEAVEIPFEEVTAEESSEESTADGLSFLDEDIEDQGEEVLLEEGSVDESPEESGADALSFLDEDFEEQGEEVLFDDSEVEHSEEDLDFLSEETGEEPEQFDSPAGAIEEAAEQFFDEPDIENEPEVDSDVGATEDALSFFDDPDEQEFHEDELNQEHIVAEDGAAAEELFDAPAFDAGSEDTFSFEVETDEIDDDDEIEFTVPGDDITVEEKAVSELHQEVSPALEPMDDDEEIEFEIPGEAVVTGAAAVAAGTAAFAFSSDEETASGDYGEDSASQETQGTSSVEEVVFEVVDDDVEVDLLPGEEFDDSVAVEDDSDEDVEFLPVDESEESGKYQSLAIMAEAIRDNVTQESVQDILVEVNRLRSSQNINFTDKTFLQLLSTVTQFVEQNREEAKGLKLLGEIISGLEMSDSGTHSSAEIQEKLFACTSQILVLQTLEYSSPALEVKAEEEVEELESEERDDTITHETVHDTAAEELPTESSGYVPMGEDEQLASFVQKELADIRKLFVDEISTLRKELADKK